MKAIVQDTTGSSMSWHSDIAAATLGFLVESNCIAARASAIRRQLVDARTVMWRR